MRQSLLSRTALILLSTTLWSLGAACSLKDRQMITTRNQESASSPESFVQPIDPVNAAAATMNTSAKPKSSAEANASFQTSIFDLALDKATGASAISQSAQSIDDWQLVANQYQDAIVLMRQVKKDSLFFDSAQSKIREYQRHIKNAKAKIKPPPKKPLVADNIPVKIPEIHSPRPSQRANNPSPSPRVKLAPPSSNSIPIPVPAPNTNKSPVVKQARTPKQIFTALIRRRIGGTPIIQVTFNGDRQFEMILDTGASGTVITQKMASSLGVIPVGKAKANTASAKGVEFPIGYVKSIQVDGARVNQVGVAIAGPELEVGLLGQDFFSNYDITIKRNLIEFHPRTESPTNFGESGQAVPIFPKPSRYAESP